VLYYSIGLTTSEGTTFKIMNLNVFISLTVSYPNGALCIVYFAWCPVAVLHRG